MKPENLNKFVDSLQNVDWSHVTDLNDTEDSYHAFIETYTKLFDACCPKKNQKP